MPGPEGVPADGVRGNLLAPKHPAGWGERRIWCWRRTRSLGQGCRNKPALPSTYFLQTRAPGRGRHSGLSRARSGGTRGPWGARAVGKRCRVRAAVQPWGTWASGAPGGTLCGGTGPSARWTNRTVPHQHGLRPRRAADLYVSSDLAAVSSSQQAKFRTGVFGNRQKNLFKKNGILNTSVTLSPRITWRPPVLSVGSRPHGGLKGHGSLCHTRAQMGTPGSPQGRVPRPVPRGRACEGRTQLRAPLVLICRYRLLLAQSSALGVSVCPLWSQPAPQGWGQELIYSQRRQQGALKDWGERDAGSVWLRGRSPRG